MLSKARLAFVPIILCGAMALLMAGCGGGGGTAPVGGGSVTGKITEPGKNQLTRDLSGHVASIQDTELTVAVNPNDGSFQIDGVPPGEQVVSVTDAAGNSAAHMVVEINEGKATDIGEVLPIPAGQIVGFVSERETSTASAKPLVGARVRAVPLVGTTEKMEDVANGRFHLHARTGSRGSYTIKGVPPGKYLVIAKMRGFERGAKELDVMALSTTAADFQLEGQQLQVSSVVGRVVTRRDNGETVGVPRAFVVLHLSQAGPEEERPDQLTVTNFVTAVPHKFTPRGGRASDAHRPLFAFTGPHGFYEMHHVRPGEYNIVALKRGFEPAPKTVTVEADGQKNEVNFQLTHQGVDIGFVNGTVTDGDTAEPLTGAYVVAHFRKPEWGLNDTDPIKDAETGTVHLPQNGSHYAVKPRPVISTRTDDSGKYQLKLESGRYKVIAFKRGYKPRRTEVDVTAGQEHTADFPLQPAHLPVTDESGTGSLN